MTKYKDFNICIDEVKRLGDFIEIEILTDEGNEIEKYERKILEIARELEINEKDRVRNFYDSMIAELNRQGK